GRVELECTECRVTLHALTLRVAARAALERLPGGLPVPKQPEWLCVVEARTQASARATGAHAGRLVAVRAERAAVMAARAFEPAPVGLRGVARHVVRRVETACACRTRRIGGESGQDERRGAGSRCVVAVHAHRAAVTCLAGRV